MASRRGEGKEGCNARAVEVTLECNTDATCGAARVRPPSWKKHGRLSLSTPDIHIDPRPSSRTSMSPPASPTSPTPPTPTTPAFNCIQDTTSVDVHCTSLRDPPNASVEIIFQFFAPCTSTAARSFASSSFFHRPPVGVTLGVPPPRDEEDILVDDDALALNEEAGADDDDGHGEAAEALSPAPMSMGARPPDPDRVPPRMCCAEEAPCAWDDDEDATPPLIGPGIPAAALRPPCAPWSPLCWRNFDWFFDNEPPFATPFPNSAEVVHETDVPSGLGVWSCFFVVSGSWDVAEEEDGDGWSLRLNMETGNGDGDGDKPPMPMPPDAVRISSQNR